MRKIAILGCGWLGLPLGKSLAGKGFVVNGSTTTENKLPLLQQSGISPFRISLSEDAITGEIDKFLEGAQILIIDIPPKLRGNPSASFVSKIALLLPFIQDSQVENVIFISSTSVFADQNQLVTETTTPNPDTESGRQLHTAEQLLQNSPGFQTTVIRFAGLIGEDRHPVHFLSGKKGVENPEAPVNLIHQKDCIGLIEQVIKVGFWNQTLHGVAPQHPSRESYYPKVAAQMNLALPEFETGKPSTGKTILSEKAGPVLGYRFETSIV